eukprot:478969-Prorocentrum_minimum.AAC.3
MGGMQRGRTYTIRPDKGTCKDPKGPPKEGAHPELRLEESEKSVEVYTIRRTQAWACGKSRAPTRRSCDACEGIRKYSLRNRPRKIQQSMQTRRTVKTARHDGRGGTSRPGGAHPGLCSLPDSGKHDV